MATPRITAISKDTCVVCSRDQWRHSLGCPLRNTKKGK